MKSLPLKSLAAALSCALLALPVAATTAGVENRPQTQTQTQESVNKRIVIQLSQSMLSNVDINSLGRYFAKDLIQHDSNVQNGRHAMLNWIQSMRQQGPARTLRIEHVLADRDMVFVHSHISATPANEMSGLNRYDFYRLDDGIIVEHWSVQADAPTSSASGNSQFSDLYTYASPPAPLSRERVELNRLLVKSLAEDVFGARNFALADRFWAAGYIQHNPYIVSGRTAFIGALPYISPEGSRYRVVRTMADGDLAVVCAHGIEAGNNSTSEFTGFAVCDLFRVVNYELVEHWDVVQNVPPSSVNGNSMFSDLYRKGH